MNNTFMNRTVLFSLLIAGGILISLPGCISKKINVVPQEVVTLTEENSRTVTDDKNSFEVRLPNDFELAVELEDAGARFLRIAEKDSDPPETKMYIEVSPGTIEATSSMLTAEESVTFQSEEDIAINGMLGKKMTVTLSHANGLVPFYFLRAEGKTYVFSLAGGETWEYFEPIINSFNLVK